MGRPQQLTIASAPAWVLVGLLGMICIALSSGIQPWAAAIAGAFLPADIAQDAAAARLFVAGTNPYGPAIRQAQADLSGLPLQATFPHFPHPPFSLIVGLPMAFLSFPASAVLWFVFTLALTFVLAALIEANPAAGMNFRPLGVWRVWLLLLVWPPVLYNLEKGQWSVLLAVLLALAAQRIALNDLRGAAVWAAVAASVKVFPVVLGGYFILRSLRATGWFVVTGMTLTALPLLWVGGDAFSAFVAESRSNMPYWESYPLVMFSIHGAISRLFVGGQWAMPLVHAPTAAWILEAFVVVPLLALAAWTTIAARRGTVHHALAFSAWLVLLPMLNPQSLGHNGVLLAPVIVLVACILVRSGRDWQRWAWAVSLMLVSLPKQTVWRLASPPATPTEGLVIAALPTWGSLLLFLTIVSMARDQAGRQNLAVPARASDKMIGLPR